jgi:hypothetical protein
MLGAISKRYHPSIGKSVTSFMVGRREKACYLPALQNDAIGPPLPPWSRDGAAAFGGITAARSARWRGSS